MSVRHLTPLPGGRRPDALVPGRSHVANLRPSLMQQAQSSGHPVLFDREAQPVDRPVIPSLVMMALDRVGQFVRVPGCDISRLQAVEALDVIAAWARPDLFDADECPVNGLPRPS